MTLGAIFICHLSDINHKPLPSTTPAFKTNTTAVPLRDMSSSGTKASGTACVDSRVLDLALI